jgi:hypothetical protein
VLISATAYARIADAAVVRPLGELSVEGKADPVAAYLLTKLTTEAAAQAGVSTL